MINKRHLNNIFNSYFKIFQTKQQIQSKILNENFNLTFENLGETLYLTKLKILIFYTVF